MSRREGCRRRGSWGGWRGSGCDHGGGCAMSIVSRCGVQLDSLLSISSLLEKMKEFYGEFEAGGRWILLLTMRYHVGRCKDWR